MPDETEGLVKLKRTLSPTIYNDVSTSTAGIVANELAHEEDLTEDAGANYGSTAVDEPDRAEDPEYAVPKTELILIMSAICMGSYLSALDTTVVTTLLTVIASDLDAVPRMSFIGTSYLLSCSAFQPLFGRISDVFGRKAVLLACAFSFALGCAICGFSNSLWPLVIGRFITGIGGGGLTSLGTITMSDLVSLRKRGLFQGIANIFFATGAASGGLIGGLISDNFGWRYVFHFQIPLALVSAILLALYLNLPAGSPGRGAEGHDVWQKLKKIDFVGSALLVSSLTGIICAAAFGGEDIPYDSALFMGLVVCSLALLALFAYLEVYVIEHPIIPVVLLGDRSVLSCSLANWFYTAAIFGSFFYIPVYFATVLDLNATQNGLRVIPTFFVSSVASISAGLYMKHTGRYLKFVVISAFVGVVGFVWLTRIDQNINLFEQYTLLLLPQVAYASVLTVTLLGLIAAVPASYQASTTSIQYTFRATGSTLGVSICSAIFARKLESSLLEKVAGAAPVGADVGAIVSKAKMSADYIKEAPQWCVAAIRASYAEGCYATYAFCLVVSVLGWLSCCCIKEYELHKSIDRK